MLYLLFGTSGTFIWDSTNICAAPVVCSPLWEAQTLAISLTFCRDHSQILKKDFYTENVTTQVLFLIRSMKSINYISQDW